MVWRVAGGRHHRNFASLLTGSPKYSVQGSSATLIGVNVFGDLRLYILFIDAVCDQFLITENFADIRRGFRDSRYARTLLGLYGILS
jgi:hypothetical protein